MPLKNGIVFDAEAHDSDPQDGIFLFDDLLGQLQPRLPQIEVTARPGIAGEAFRNTGVRAVPSTLVSVHYVADAEAARDAIEAYLVLLDGGPHELFQHGFSWGKVRVRSYSPFPLEPVAVSTGTIIPFPTKLQRISWELIATYVPPEP